MKKIIKRIKDKIRKILFQMRFLRLAYGYSREERVLVLLGTEDFANLGDHHIAISEIAFLKKYFSEYRLVELPASYYFHLISKLEKVVKNSWIVLLTGGGNMGDVYPYSESIRQDAILRFPKNLKFIFPQTVDYQDLHGNAFMTSKTLYSKENQVVMFTREKYSYEFVSRHYDCDHYLVPDMVLFSKYEKSYLRQGILLCMRTDIERSIDQDTLDRIVSSCHGFTKDIQFTDSQVENHVLLNKRISTLRSFIEAFARRKVVITDRLHGMVFCGISNTPCIVLPNFNYKVLGVYQWLKSCDTIKFVEINQDEPGFFEEIEQELEILYQYERGTSLDFTKEFNQMHQIMRTYIP